MKPKSPMELRRERLRAKARQAAPTPTGTPAPAPAPPTPPRPPAEPRGLPGVAVILTARNQARWLKQALRSLLTQSHRPAELIYADDGSNDNSVAEAAWFGRAVRVVQFQRQGVCASRNAAYELLRANRHETPYVLFADGDDVLSAHVIEEGARALDEDLALGAAYCRMIRWHEDVGSDVMSAWPSDQSWDYDRLVEQNFIGQPTVMRREAFEGAGLWQADEDLWTPTDWLLWLRMSRAGWGFRLLRERAFALYRQHSGQHSRVAQDVRDEAYRRVMMRLPVTVLTPFAHGRPWSLDLWRGNLLRSGLPLERAHVIAADNMADPAATRRLTNVMADLPLRGWTVLPVRRRLDYDAMTARVDPLASPVNVFMCGLWRRVLALADGDLLWSLEDDVRLPDDGYGRLVASLRPNVGMVGSPVASRWRTPPDVMVGLVDQVRPYRIAVKTVDGKRFKSWGDLTFEGVEDVGSLSVSSTLIRRSVWRGHAPMVSPNGDGRFSGHEHSLMRRCLQFGRRILCDWTTPADHRLDADTALTVDAWRKAHARPDYYQGPQRMERVTAAP